MENILLTTLCSGCVHKELCSITWLAKMIYFIARRGNAHLFVLGLYI